MDVTTAKAGRRARGAIVALAALAGCANYIGTTAQSFMNQVRQSPDPNVRNLAYRKLASPNCYTEEAQKDVAAHLLAEKLLEGKEPAASRAQICRTLAELGLPAARAAVRRTVEDEDSTVRAEACRALGAIGEPEDAAVLSRIMAADTSGDCRVAAIGALGALKTGDPRVIELLIDGLEHDDPGIRLACLRALRTASGKDVGVEPKAWRDYYNARFAALKQVDAAHQSQLRR